MKAEGDGAMNDGGDDENKEGDAAAAEAPKSSTPEPSAFELAADGDKLEIPKLLVCMLVCFPAFADAVKAQVCDIEFGGSGKTDLAPAVAIAASYIDGAKDKENAVDSFGCTWVTDDDLADLKAADTDKEKKALVFPGVVLAYPDEAGAVGSAGEAKDKKKVIFKFANKAFKVAGDKVHVMYRPMGKVKSLKEADGVTTVEMEDFAAATFESIKAYTEKVAALAEAAKKGVEAVKDATKGDDPPKDPPKDEGGDAPAE